MSAEWRAEKPTEFEVFERREFPNSDSAEGFVIWAKKLGLIFVYRYWRGKHNVWRLG